MMLEIYLPLDFEKRYAKYRSMLLNILKEKGRAEGEKIKKELIAEEKTEFLDNESVIKFGNKKCQLPPYKNEHFFCRAIYEHPINEPIDWSIIYEKMTGYYEDYYGKPKEIRDNWHAVYDTMEAINNRVKEVLGIEKLFIWQEKTVKRTK